MPARFAVSGHGSPGIEDNINVAMLKPTTPFGRVSSNLQESVQPTPSRPKRKISKPSRYSDSVFEPPTKKRASAASVMSSRMSTPTITPTPTEPESTLFTPLKLIKLIKPLAPERKDSDNAFKPAGYGANFLMHYIEDSNPSTDAEALPQSEYQEEHSSELNDSLASDAVPELDSASGHSLSMGSINVAQHATFTSPQLISSTPISTELQQIDSAERIINKLQVACHALSSLNILPTPTPVDPRSLQETQPGKHPTPAPQSASSELPSDDGVHFLLSAAAGSDSSEPQVIPKESLKTSIGEPDVDLSILIRNAIQILHNYAVIKEHSLHATSLAGGDASKKRGSSKSQSCVDTERFALSALTQLLHGGVISVNCLISEERGHLTQHLYAQLQSLVMASKFRLPGQVRTFPQILNGTVAPHTMGLPTIMQKQPQPQVTMHLQNAIPPPHQFLGRRNTGQYIPPYPMNPILMDQFKMYDNGRGFAPVMPNPVFMGGFPGGSMRRHSHPMILQQPPHHFMVNQPMVQMQYNTFPPTSQQMVYHAPQQTLPMPSHNNFHYPLMPTMPTNNFQFHHPVTTSNIEASRSMFVPAPDTDKKKGRPKRSSSRTTSKRTVVRPGSHRPLAPMPVDAGAQRVPKQVTLGND